MTKVLVLQILATVGIAGAGAAATVATRVNPSPALRAIAAAPLPQLILATRNKAAASKRGASGSVTPAR